MNRKIKILFVCPYFSSFIQKDLELLKNHFDVRVVVFVLSRKNLKGTLMTMLNLIKGVLWADITFSWFAETHALWAVRLSKIFKKKSIVVVGGYEVAKVSEIGYGAMLNPRFAHRVKFVLENADKVLAVSEFNKKEILKYTNSKHVELVYNGVDHDNFKPNGEKENIVVTASVGDNWKRIRLKGLDTFVNSAKFLPDVKFLMIGIEGDTLKKLKDFAPSNVQFIDLLSQIELLPYYQRAKVYCQLSYRESFCMSLAEAMLGECTPVVTNRGAIQEVVGDTGFYVPYDNPKATAEAIEKALKSDKGKDARERIKNMFPKERRERKLIKIIYEVMK
jgi:glycosyltransferase involved in cell wall biosynthesis